MAISQGTIDYLQELFAVVPDAHIRRMFGGVGIFRHGLMFALSLEDGRIAFKADGETTPEFEAEGCSQWVYERAGGKKASMGYWYIPEYLLDDQEAFAEWAEKAFSAAARIDAAKPPSQRKLKL